MATAWAVKRESEIQHDIRLALGADARVLLWRNNTGVAKHKDGASVRYGLCVGSSDLIGIVTMPDGTGRFLAFEVKTQRGGLTTEQTLFLQLVRKRGGFAAVVRSVEEATQAVARALRGESE